MLELLLCSLLTVFPDYLYRRYAQGKRLGREITFARNPGMVPQRDIEKLEVLLTGRQGALDAAMAASRSRQDVHSRRRGRARRAVHASRRRCRQSRHAIGGHSHSGERGSRALGRVWAD
jgi:hypothetical protein